MSTTPNQTSTPDPRVTLVEEEEKKKLNQIAQELTSATQNYHAPEDLVPHHQKTPLPELVESSSPPKEDNKAEGHEPEVIDVIKGFQGRMRTGPAKDFLKSKMKWLSKKSGGAPVTLK